MSRWIISDLHLGHANICRFSPYRLGDFPYTSIKSHDATLKFRWSLKVDKKDQVYVLGDVAFTREALDDFATWPGTKILVRGNHDKMNEHLYRDIFYRIHGIIKLSGHWLSHAPIHPQELRGLVNLHGHVHSDIIKDDRYRSVCVEANKGWPENLDKILEKS